MPASNFESFKTRLKHARPWRARSLIVTILGDAINPHGGLVWLRSLAELAQPLDVSDRLVRTAVNRLAREGWLEAHQRGRRSYYQLTPSGRETFESADRRIYGPHVAAWDGRWRMALMPERLSATDRERIRRELMWRGFAPFGQGTFVHPSADLPALETALSALPGGEQVVKFEAMASAADGERLARRFTESVDLAALKQMYAEFARTFEPADRFVDLSPEDAFALRTLLVHELRRIVLRDPQLPASMLPPDWPGPHVRQLCRSIYGNTIRASEAFVCATAEGLDGHFEPDAAAPASELAARFGGPA